MAANDKHPIERHIINLISELSSLNHARHLMAYAVNNQHVFKSGILPEWMTKICYSWFPVFVYDSLITNYEIQLDGENPYLTNL